MTQYGHANQHIYHKILFFRTIKLFMIIDTSASPTQQQASK